MRLAPELIAQMIAEINEAGGTVHGPTVASVFAAYNIWCMPPYWKSAAETRDAVYECRKSRNQEWTTRYQRDNYK